MDVRRIRMSLGNLGRRRGVRIRSREMGGGRRRGKRRRRRMERREGKEGRKIDKKKTIDLSIPFNIIRQNFRINSFSGALTGRPLLLTR